MPRRPLFRPLDSGLILDNDVNNDDVENNDVDNEMPLESSSLVVGTKPLPGVGSGRSRLRVRRLKSVGASVLMASVASSRIGLASRP
jgi:hypothetical protein